MSDASLLRDSPAGYADCSTARSNDGRTGFFERALKRDRYGSSASNDPRSTWADDLHPPRHTGRSGQSEQKSGAVSESRRRKSWDESVSKRSVSMLPRTNGE